MLCGTQSSIEASNYLGVQEVHLLVRNPKLHYQIQNLRVME